MGWGGGCTAKVLAADSVDVETRKTLLVARMEPECCESAGAAATMPLSQGDADAEEARLVSTKEIQRSFKMVPV